MRRRKMCGLPARRDLRLPAAASDLSAANAPPLALRNCIIAGAKSRDCRSYGICAGVALCMMLVGAVGMNLVPAADFGVVERFSVFAATGFNAATLFLLLDPLYLSALCGLFGGGDMTGIALLLPAWAARGGFGALLLANGFVLWKKALPTYKKSFSDTETKA